MKTGYVFVGWYKDVDLSMQWNFATDTVMQNITLYAAWAAIEYSNQLSFILPKGYCTENE